MRTKAIRLALLALLASCAPTQRVLGRAPENPTREPVRDPLAPSPAKRNSDRYQRYQNEADEAGPRVVEVVEADARIGVATTHMFHRTECALLKGLPTAEQVRFTNQWDALNSGYRPCDECRPTR